MKFAGVALQQQDAPPVEALQVGIEWGGVRGRVENGLRGLHSGLSGCRVWSCWTLCEPHSTQGLSSCSCSVNVTTLE